MTAEIIKEYPFDHAGVGETSLLMSLCPDGVDMSRFSEDKWYLRSAREATAELGAKGREMVLGHMRDVLGIAAKR
jgi:creatinine amidohydrolase/Fe(II)-dependent formamide hydrolase-like protein